VKLLLTALLLGGVASGVPHLLLRRPGVSAAASSPMCSASWRARRRPSAYISERTRSCLRQVLDADAIVGSGLACVVIGRRSAWLRASACAGARKHGFEIAFG
jgi:hypothetical protein